jgi:hypothetical protein
MQDYVQLRITQALPLMKSENPAQSTQDTDIRVNAICGEYTFFSVIGVDFWSLFENLIPMSPLPSMLNSHPSAALIGSGLMSSL